MNLKTTCLALWLGVSLLASSLAVQAEDAPETIRFGFQKYGTLTLLKERQILEKHFADQKINITWTEFPAGPQMLEALNVGSIDFGTVGETPPVFAQAADAALYYVAHEPAAPKGEALIVPKDSPLQTVKDLKGKRVALNKGSNVHYLLVKALEEAGLTIKDIEPVYLPPADARAAFEGNKVDAWVIWDPFLAAAQSALQARVLRDGEGLVKNYQYYIAAKNFADHYPSTIKTIVENLQTLDQWTTENFTEAANILAPAISQPQEVVEVAIKRGGYGTQFLTPEIIEYQQKIADTFSDLALIPKKLDVKSVVWQPK
ncbi:sulfonate ABC transporter substrate-binding protein [uncultured Thiothrix sp.]|uniref:sulfonate ABC transporter substrate-binding protein n=1 Tax=uncultured Thiothrix sp. TaxID=223185 RepID=UPI0026175891|nr:sulfonate ABC transporter substrate-binding protein [uncultured Thiothrix sp.]